MIRILIVDDSISVRELLYRYFSDQEDMEVAGMAVTGAEAIEKVHKLKPDIVTMDIHLPDMDGFQVTRRIMEESPLPIVIISSVASPDDSDDGFRALDSGALTLIDKPRLCDSDFEENMNGIIHTVRLMSEVKVVRRRIKKNLKNSGSVIPVRSDIKGRAPKENIEAVCIGTSTGGPQALKAVLGALPENYPLPILVVQHMSKGFLEGMVNWLDNVIPLKVKAAGVGETVRGGFVYFAPEEKHMSVNSDLTVSFSSASASDGIIPSVSVLFASAARNLGHRAAGIIMTGMGRDGAAELLEMRKAGSYTIAQNKETCTVYGMPGEAVNLGAAIDILPLEEISGELLNFAGIKS